MTDPVEVGSEENWEALLASLNEHASLIGQVSISWNMCQLLVFLLFYMLSGMTWEDARAVFFALKSDVQQRDITTAVATSHLTATISPRKKVIAAITRLHELANERNAATHTMWSVVPEAMGLRPAEGILHNPKLDLSDPKLQFALLDKKLSSAHGALLKASFLVLKHETLRKTASAQTPGPRTN